ncbi:hypothetical protein JJD26997_0295 [Campylobacter jejuni subsp. doylei 269.97]|uniref:Uncharacterized protein n=2 Tax=Campylobacter jejuni subsp. doylei (strain ATCC BAA-1458 / RM4099 / 269.97) TaxID=360109 RepID=A7H1Y1_CAMJD|nr:hypothetical protein JJD26997_0295 [Campylobacter jejuni subsp. doylei 269.97]
MKTLREQIEVMEAFERGEKIQANYKLKNFEYWEDTKNPIWDWHFYDYRVKPRVKITEKEFNLIKERLTGWKYNKDLIYENQRESFFSNAFGELRKYFRAKNDLEKVNALCNIVVYCFNDFDINCQEILEIHGFETNKITIFDIVRDLSSITTEFHRNEIPDYTFIHRLVFDCFNLINNLGFNFYKCMLETIKDIESHAWYYDESLGKFVEKIGAYSEREAFDLAINDFKLTNIPNKYFLDKEDKDYWYVKIEDNNGD